jgi:heme iron utilization protein
MADPEQEPNGGPGAGSDEAVGLGARRLLRGARSATLATVSAGQPFAALVTPATDGDLSPLLLLSSLSEHTRHLLAEPRCALHVAGPPAGVNPQTAPRVTVSGLAERVDDARLKARWLARHPYAGFYVDFPDFSMWRITVRGGLFVRGFALASRLRMADLLPAPDAVAAIAAAEREIVAHCNKDHPDALAAIAGGGEWWMVAVDIDGFDLASGETVRRFDWPEPVGDAGDVRRHLIQMTRAARTR